MDLKELIKDADKFQLQRDYFKKLKDNKEWFRDKFKLDELDKMDIKRYIVQKDNYPDIYDEAFIYELERGKKIGGGIGGRNASKSYIYMDRTGKYCIGAGNNKRYVEGIELETEYRKLMSKIKKAIELANDSKYEDIENLNIPIFKTMLLKILAIYLPDKFLDIYSKDKLVELGKIVGVKSDIDSIVELNAVITETLRNVPELANLGNIEITGYLYSKIPDPKRKPTYWSLGHNYGGQDMLGDFKNDSKICIGYVKENLEDVIGDIKLLEEYLVSIDASDNERRILKQFSSIKAGDIIFLKASFTRGEKGKTTVYRIDAVAKVLEDVKEGYEFDKELGHCVKVEFLDYKPVEIEGINYIGTLVKVSNKEILEVIYTALKGDSKVVVAKLGKSDDVPISVIDDDSLDESPKNFILYGPPGTGKTYNVIDKALEIIEEDYSEIKDSREKVLNRYKQLVESGQIEFCTFHQSYGYEEFVEGLKSDGNGNFIPEDGVLKRIALRAAYDELKKEGKKEASNEEELTYEYKKDKVLKYINCEKVFRNNKKYVLIIDEINRGNISKIFGELITLLEEDKRIGTTNHVTVNLPYTKDHFALPSNLYIIGTMNTSDKSIAQIDIALRRRFNFIEMMPSYDDLGEIDGIELDKLLETMNKRIEFLLDRDHLIGHAYLARVNNMIELQDTMRNKIIPLIQEYFYGDNEKVGMALGGIGSKSSNEYIVYKEVIKANDLFKGFSNISDLGSKENFVVNEDITSDRIRKIYE